MALQVRNKTRPPAILPGHKTIMARWIIGRDAYAAQDYLIHTNYPAFFAKIGHSDEEGLLSGLSYATSDNRSFFDFVWFDPLPDMHSFRSLMREAEDAMEAHQLS